MAHPITSRLSIITNSSGLLRLLELGRHMRAYLQRRQAAVRGKRVAPHRLASRGRSDMAVSLTKIVNGKPGDKRHASERTDNGVYWHRLVTIRMNVDEQPLRSVDGRRLCEAPRNSNMSA